MIISIYRGVVITADEARKILDSSGMDKIECFCPICNSNEYPKARVRLSSNKGTNYFARINPEDHSPFCQKFDKVKGKVPCLDETNIPDALAAIMNDGKEHDVGGGSTGKTGDEPKESPAEDEYGVTSCKTVREFAKQNYFDRKFDENIAQFIVPGLYEYGDFAFKDLSKVKGLKIFELQKCKEKKFAFDLETKTLYLQYYLRGKVVSFTIKFKDDKAFKAFKKKYFRKIKETNDSVVTREKKHSEGKFTYYWVLCDWKYDGFGGFYGEIINSKQIYCDEHRSYNELLKKN